MLTRKIGELLIALENATMTVWGDDACITKIQPSPKYESKGILLDVTISIKKSEYKEEDYRIKMDIWDALIFDSVFNYNEALLKVDIHFKEL